MTNHPNTEKLIADKEAAEAALDQAIKRIQELTQPITVEEVDTIAKKVKHGSDETRLFSYGVSSDEVCRAIQEYRRLRNA